MKKLFNKIYLSLFPRKKSTLLEDLMFTTVVTKYSAAIVRGIDRPAGIKMWRVAAKTVEPEVVCTTHSKWMQTLKVERAILAETIGLLEKNEILLEAQKAHGLRCMCVRCMGLVANK